MIDVHLHILPGIDDGPQTLEESVALARALVQEGVQTCIATPHYNDVFPQRSAEEIRARVDALQQVLGQQQIPLQVLPGHEVLIKPGLVEDLLRGRAATLNGGRYVLLEFWTNTWLPETEQVVFDLRAAGFIPLLAHPERYQAVQQDSSRLEGLRRQGVLFQVTLGSLVGMQGRSAQKCAEKLLKKGLVDCFASDAHSLGHRRPAIQDGLRAARRLLKTERLHQLTEDWPVAIAQNALVSAS